VNAPGAPSPVDLGRRLAPSAPYHKGVRALHDALAACDPAKPLAERQAALERLVAWVRDPAPPPVESPPSFDRSQHARLAIVLDILDEAPAWREAVGHTLALVLAETSAVHLFAEVGVPSDRGLLDETMDRLAQRLLPRVREEHDLADCFAAALPARRDAEWLGDLPPELAARVWALLSPEEWAPLRRDLGDAVRLLATRVAALGLSEEIRARADAERLDESPFYALPRACDALVAGSAGVAPILDLSERIHAELQLVHLHMERAGVSVDIVYRLDVIARALERIELIAPLLDATMAPEARRLRAPGVAATLVAAGAGDVSFRHILQESTRLLAQKVIERVGSTGEHYITRSRREWWAMLRSAGGGGVLTAGTAALKFLVGWAKLPMFIEAIVNTANYAGSFILMQLMGFTLATKQPSMTAAALAAALRSSEAMRRVEETVSMIARMTRSQLAAAMGNIGLVVPATFLLDQWHRWSTGGQPFLDAKTAAYVVKSLHPTESLTIWFAALTGVFLWLASLGAGWLENWVVYRRLPEAIEQHRLQRLIGKRGTHWLADKLRKHVAGVGGSVSLGALLGFAPVLGKGFGLPIDVRHVTLSTGSLTLAGCSLGWHGIMNGQYLGACIGILVIGTLNFGVSFVLALWVAMRARAVGTAEKVAVAKGVIARVVRRPMEFIYPPKGEPDGEHEHAARPTEHDGVDRVDAGRGLP
jgi:site-specific recombinase